MDFDRKAVSHALGWASGLCWVVLSFPQFWEIYDKKTGRGLSLDFVLLWALGDGLNMLGCLFAYQLNSQLYIAIWYIIMDIVLIGMMAYYDWWLPKSNGPTSLDERDALLENCPVPDDSPTAAKAVGTLFTLSGMANLLQLTVGKTVNNNKEGIGRVLLSTSSKSDVCPYSLWVCNTGMAMGWASSFGYLLARIPQIVKNQKRRSTTGLSVWMFILSVMGNLTYSASIIAWSTDSTFLWEKFPWLVGSLGTVIFDLTILAQFLLYSKVHRMKMAETNL